jgi:hypothetical protein
LREASGWLALQKNRSIDVLTISTSRSLLPEASEMSASPMSARPLDTSSAAWVQSLMFNCTISDGCRSESKPIAFWAEISAG